MFKTAVQAGQKEIVFKIKIINSFPGANSDVLISLQKTLR